MYSTEEQANHDCGSDELCALRARGAVRRWHRRRVSPALNSARKKRFELRAIKFANVELIPRLHPGIQPEDGVGCCKKHYSTGGEHSFQFAYEDFIVDYVLNNLAAYNHVEFIVSKRQHFSIYELKLYSWVVMLCVRRFYCLF